ncbi:Liprin-beta-1 [Hypsibius exemplaris]|uniref:Liprin-beta-1 n=1 Tax=Hypsibius exemplaris TaxID=2072580 RepID=A0A1W0WVV8_HYPEX|nr:Liprin-beta-1 [Hypsibius exemplaris]
MSSSDANQSESERSFVVDLFRSFSGSGLNMPSAPATSSSSQVIWHPRSAAANQVVNGTNSMPRLRRPPESGRTPAGRTARSKSPNRRRPASLMLTTGCDRCTSCSESLALASAAAGHPFAGSSGEYYNTGRGGSEFSSPAGGFYRRSTECRNCWEDSHSLASESSGHINAPLVDRMAEAVKRAESERDNLQDQLTLIFEQTKTQREKIHELQDMLLDKALQLESTEDLLREEMLSRSQLETNKLDLVTEMEDMRLRMMTNGSPYNHSNSSGSLKRNGTIDGSHQHVRTSPVNDMQQLRSELEHEKLRKTVELLTVKLEEKDRRIRQLEEALRMSNIRESDIVTRNGDYSARGDDSRDGGRKPPAIPRPSTASSQRKNYPVAHQSSHSLVNSAIGSDDSLARYAESDENGVSMSNRINGSSSSPRRRESSSRSTNSGRSRSTDGRLARPSDQPSLSYHSRQQQGSFRVLAPLSPSKSLGEKMSASSMSSSLGYLMRQRSLSSGPGQSDEEINRCSSVPNLNGRVGSQESDRIRASTPKSGFSEDKKRGLRKFFDKFTRSNSPQLDESLENQSFKRGGVRSTAGARLQHTGGGPPRRRWDVNSPVDEWTADMAIQWLEEDVQIPVPHTGKAWLRNGHALFSVTSHDMEKEMGISHPIHRKKLTLAINAKKDKDTQPMGKLDYLLVLRWLDDLNLPQYKDAFADARIDGRTLNFLTTDDLFYLKITNALHQASIKRGIQVLRECNFDMSRIKRRTAPNDPTSESPLTVLYWSSQRVMEWLELLDLAEYQPSLRGCGVHGGLMVLEDRFNAELLAELMSIPQSKTLLRRHLSKSFTELLGGEVIRLKRAAQAAPGFVSLSPQLKLKPVRRAFSLVRKRSKSDAVVEVPDYICPPDLKIDRTALDLSPIQLRKDSSTLSREDNCDSPSLNSLTLTTV